MGAQCGGLATLTITLRASVTISPDCGVWAALLSLVLHGGCGEFRVCDFGRAHVATRKLPPQIPQKPEGLLDPSALEETGVRRVLLDVGRIALFVGVLRVVFLVGCVPLRF